MTPPKNKKRAGSAQQKFVQCKDDYCRAKIKERHLCAEKLAKSIERLDGEMSSTDREQILTKCKEILDINVHLSNQQVKMNYCQFILRNSSALECAEFYFKCDWEEITLTYWVIQC